MIADSVIYLSCISLFFLAVQDIFNNKKIDERKNYFMSGMVSFAYIASGTTLFILISYLALVVGLTKFIGNYLGKGDIQILLWLIPTHYFYSIYTHNPVMAFIGTATFLLLLGSLIFFFELMKKINKTNMTIPGIPIILGAQLITSILIWVRI